MGTKPIRIAVHASPSAKKNAVGGQHDGMLKVRVTAAPEKGKANKAIAKELAGAIGVKRSQLSLISGESNRQKVFEVSDPPADLADRLAELMS